MPAALITKQEVLTRLLATFRADGYDGASLAELSQRTGLGKSSLYHYFPGGKAEMATAVLAHLEGVLSAAFGNALAGKSPEIQLSRLLEAVDAFYASGKSACLLERLSASVDRSRFKKPLARAFENFVAVFVDIGRAAGLGEKVARARAESAVIRIEGALVLVAGTGDTGVFTRALHDIKSTFLART
jgi:TetR/AcrR family transcriptional regulator, lmrAB and yxaGH operons repressor